MLFYGVFLLIRKTTGITLSWCLTAPSCPPEWGLWVKISRHWSSRILQHLQVSRQVVMVRVINYKCRVLYTGLYSLRVIFALFNLQTISPRFEFAQMKLCVGEIFWDSRIRLILNAPADNRGERGENQTGANMSLYTVLSMGEVDDSSWLEVYEFE